MTHEFKLLKEPRHPDIGKVDLWEEGGLICYRHIRKDGYGAPAQDLLALDPAHISGIEATDERHKRDSIKVLHAGEEAHTYLPGVSAEGFMAVWRKAREWSR